MQPTFIFITCSSPWYLQHLIKTRNKQLPGLCLSLFNNREQQLTMKLGFIYFCLLISSQTRYSSVCTWLILPSLPPLQPLSQPQLWRRFTAVLPCPSTLVLGQRLHLLSYNGKLVSVYLFFKLPTKNMRSNYQQHKKLFEGTSIAVTTPERNQASNRAATPLWFRKKYYHSGNALHSVFVSSTV